MGGRCEQRLGRRGRIPGPRLEEACVEGSELPPGLGLRAPCDPPRVARGERTSSRACAATGTLMCGGFLPRGRREMGTSPER